MAFVDASGLSEPTSTVEGKASPLMLAKGVSSPTSEVFGKGVFLVLGKGLSGPSADVKGKLSQLVELDSVTVINSTKVRFAFDRPMLKDSKLLDGNNYEVKPLTSYGVAVYVQEVQPENEPEPTYVDLVITEMTDSTLYEGEVRVVAGPTDPEGTPMDPSANFDFFTGVGVAPLISSVVAVGVNRADVIFDENMEDNSAIRDKNNYAFDNGLSVVSVLDVVGDTVKLVTSDQMEGVLYTLTITNPP